MILVTGGAGFIGSHLAESLVRAGKEVVIIDNFDDFYDPAIKRKNISSLQNEPNFRLVEGDIRKDAESVIADNSVDRVVHLAARAGVRPSIEQPLLYEDVNIKGTLVLLEACRHNGVKNFIFGSSSSVYGVNRDIPFKETDRIGKPISPYAASKAACEAYCHTYSYLYNIPITCLRFFTVYGPRQGNTNILSKCYCFAVLASTRCMPFRSLSYQNYQLRLYPCFPHYHPSFRADTVMNLW